MKRIACLLALTLGTAFAALAQKEDVRYVDNEECGCSLTYVNGIQTTQSNGRFGFKLEDGTQLVPNKYTYVDRFHNGYCQVWSDYDKAGLIDSTGKEVVPCQYDEVMLPSDGMILVVREERIGYYKTNGELGIDFQFPAASNFQEGLAAVAIMIDTDEVSFGYIDTTGRVVIQPNYQLAQPFSEGHAVVKQYDRYGIIDRQGKVCLPIKYEKITPMKNGRMFAGFPDEIAMFDEHFEPITKFAYQRIDHEGNGLYLVMRNEKYGFLNHNGKEVIKCQYDMAGGFNEGFSWVCKDDLYGIINTHGKIILPIRYENNSSSLGLYTFSEGLAPICKDGKVGYINKHGKVAIPLIYNAAKPFTEGIAPVMTTRWGYIDLKGELVIPAIFDDAETFESGRAQVMLNGRLHYMNPNGECVKDCKHMPKTWRVDKKQD